MEYEEPESLYHWRDGLPRGYGGAARSGDKAYTAYIKVETDEGITGMAAINRGQLIADLVRRRLKHFIGMNPLLTEKLWHEIWEVDRMEEFPLYALGLLDIACWDIKARKANMPLYQLIGGNDPRVPAYASTVTWDTMGEFEQHIKECQEEGFFAFKLHAWGDVKRDSTLSHNLRQWVGDDADLMFDASAGWDYVDAQKFGRELEDAGFLWYEEPMREFDLPSYAELCRNLDIAILGAENADGVHWNAATWIQYRALDMIRCDSHYKGGITGAIKIAHLAESFGMRAQVIHGGYANSHANLHLCAAIPNNDYYEAIVINSQQIKNIKMQGDLAVIDGYITAPEAPGIHPHPDWNTIEREAVLVV